MKNGSQRIKRVLSFIMAFAMVLSLVPGTVFAADVDTVVYLKPNSNWLVDGARFAVYYWNDSGTYWADLNDTDGDGYYEGTIPAGYTNLIFCRMNPGTTENNWDNKWNQSSDLTLDGTNNCYTVAEGAWDKGDGAWSVYTPAVEETDTVVYLKPNSNWLIDGARFAVYYWDDSGTYWADLSDTDGDGYYEGTIPAGYTNLIFCRMNPGTTENNWDNKWNQSSDLTLDGTNNCYTVAEGAWDKGDGTWSTYAPTTDDDETESTDPSDPEDTTDTVYYVAGTFNNWTVNGAQMTKGEDGLYSVTISGVTAGDIEFKVTQGDWNLESWGDNGSNYKITLTEDSDVTITFNPDTKAITVTTVAAVIEKVDYKVTLHFSNNLKWSKVNLYTWTGDGVNPSGGWPGTALTLDGDGYYTAVLEYNAKSGQGLNYIYNDGSTQTADLALDASVFEQNDKGVYCTEKWISLFSLSVPDVVDSADQLLNITETPVVDGTSVTFYYRNNSASSVEVRGSMTSWENGTPMEKNEQGVWTVTINDLKPDSYEYKFVVDGEWTADPWNPAATEDGNSTFLVLDPEAEDTNAVTVKVHYTRTDGDYTNRNLWVWSTKIGGQQVDFTEEDESGAKVATIVLEDARAHQSVSFKPRMSTEENEWADNTENDYTVDISDVVAGTVHYYVTAGVAGGTRVLDTDVVKAVKLISCELDYDNGTIVITTGTALDDTTDAFKVVDSDDKEAFAVTVAADGTTYTLTPADGTTLDLKTLYQYKILFQGYTYAIDINSVYASDKFAEEYTYTGDDLGADYTSASTTFKVWAPTATAVSVNLYTSGTKGTDDLIKTVEMAAGQNGVWSVTVEGDLNGTYYTYAVTVNGETVEAVDPYARTTGVNGNRGMVIDLDSTDPADGWTDLTDAQKPDSYTDAVIYELHVRDFSIDDSSGVKDEWQGKFLGLTQTGTTTENGATTGLDYLKDLGVTHIHLLPIYDYASVDETTCNTFNWGYDPQNYNTPEGSYSTDPYNGETRVKEMKEMVDTLHENGIGVIMDVVYNHVYNADTFCFNNIVPGYFSRVNSNTSGCGNDTASEREMVRKYIVESVLYWAKEYHIDGFRFDLVGLLDVQTINQIVEEVHAYRSDIIFYGEGWDMDGTNKEEGTEMAKQGNASKTPGFAYFSDSMRNGIGGSNGTSTGFASGAGNGTSMVSEWMANPWWTTNPSQIIQYASCHDNYTLVDKLIISTGASGVTDNIIKMNNLAAAFYMTAQGIPFIHAGEEMLREKLEEGGGRCENSYNASDFVNHIEWSNLDNQTYTANSDYYKGLIEFRKAHAALRYDTAAEVSANVKKTEASGNLVAFSIDGYAAGDDDIYVIFNANTSAQTVTLPDGEWTICINGESAGTDSLGTASGSVSVDAISAMVLTKADEGKDDSGDDTADTITLYYDNASTSWSTVYAYAWDSNNVNNASWPGAEMTHVDGSIWAITVSADMVNIIFNNGSGNQTADLTIPTDGKNCYNGTSWTTYGTSGTTYYLFGYINGENYACEGDYENMGEYKFVDGKLTATFTKTSYVGVKTEGNGAWYMTNGWQGEVNSATLYDTTTGITADKLYVPGGVEVTFTLVENADGTLTLSYEIAATGDPEEYFLYGYINGADYAMGVEESEYKFVDGQLTAKFDVESYVCVKNGDSSEKYMTDGWLGNVTSATLYDTAVYSEISTFDKLMVPGGVEVTFTLTVNEDNTVTLSYVVAEADESVPAYSANDNSGIQDGLTLHCWNWSFEEIKNNMAQIAEQGYTAIQTSPVQPIKESTTNSTVSGHWWIYYQPIGFDFLDADDNVLGNYGQLEEMVAEAHKYGIKVIVDVVANHMANETGNDMSEMIPEDIRNNKDYWHNITINISDYSSRKEVTQYCMGGLPDLNTSNEDVQGMVKWLLEWCVDAGVDGFRFDAAKHIETPDDDAEYASDFWPNVIGYIEEYAKTECGKDIYCYGEVLDSLNGLPISAYTKYMAVTDNSWGNTLREEISSGTADMAAGFDKAADASQLVIWAESHDTYANENGASKDETEAEINMTWALVAARADAMGLYLARPENDDQLLGIASITGWANAEVKAVNEFHNAFAGQSESIGNEGNVAYVERGASGVVLVNAKGGTATISVTANAMADGTYVDQITGNIFTVSDGKISGTIGDTGIAVVYNGSYVCWNTTTQKFYETVAVGLDEAESGETVQMLQDSVEVQLNVLADVTLDLNGCDLTATYVFAVNTSNVIDKVRTGSLKIDQGNITLSQTNSMLPVWDPAQEAYVFTNVVVDDYSTGLGLVLDEETDVAYYSFVTYFNSNVRGEDLLGDGASDNDVTIKVCVTWTEDDGTGEQSFSYNDTMVADVVTANGKRKFTLKLKNYSAAEDVQITAMVVSEHAEAEFEPAE